jgi:hypothetical protein
MSATARTSIYVGYTSVEEHVARALIRSYMLQAEIKGYTVYAAEGWWDGVKEQALVIEVIGDTENLDYGLTEVAHRLRYNEILPQESVYIVRELVDLVVV